MKNIRKGTLAILGSMLFLLGSCQQGAKKEQSTDPTTSEPVAAEPVAPPKGIISLQESKSLYDNYTKHRVDLISEYEAERSPEAPFQVARFSSFSFDEMKQYIKYIEQEADTAKVKISSLRFYFANYPDKASFVHPRQNSVFVVPTMDVNGEEYGFYIGPDGKAQLIKDAVGDKAVGKTKEGNKSYASMIPAMMMADTTSLVLDRSTSGPPPNGDY
ncbi:hypothetical protein [Allomuricauda sp. NBRC 101325]|uniref:hypothetical protein n=1 Tax=Allomuricauda sp. NBRC 101325 TaxID=1113758 RepID=UPI002556E8D1|nr:hypothetical protein [Muricauda sp. NBRC 101325]